MFRSRIYLALIFLLTFFLAGCNQTEKLEKIDFNDTVEIGRVRPSQDSEINICVGSMITPEEGYAYYKKLLDYIGQGLNKKINFVEKRTYAEVNSLLKKGDIDVAFVCGGPYVIGHDEFGLELLVAPVVNGEPLYYSYIIVDKDSGIENLYGLRGKRFAFVDPISNTGKLIPTYMLHQLGENPQSLFKEYSYTYGHDRSIKAVAQGIVDAAAVDSLIWDYMDKKGSEYTQKTKIIKVSKPYGIPPVVVRPGLNEDLKIKIKDTLLNMHNDEEGKNILRAMFIDRFIEIDDSSYDTIRYVRESVIKRDSD
ncbi:MAG: phosphate/phosphite/phosphonate ABC transporter substrate-binding protein [Candidatus Omnitrophica bacterium]|nr:phosphate/phosphite/phosphonate ABC transporter substrate-binding protein [Candidatus Omnitrophota bacterium]